MGCQQFFLIFSLDCLKELIIDNQPFARIFPLMMDRKPDFWEGGSSSEVQNKFEAGRRGC